MLELKRKFLIEKLGAQEIVNENGHNHLVNNVLYGDGKEVMAFLVKKGEVSFSDEELQAEINQMVEEDIINIEQWEQMLNLLKNARNGNERVANFIRKKRRVLVV